MNLVRNRSSEWDNGLGLKVCYNGLWSPIDPSGILRCCYLHGSNDLHSQLVYTNRPCEVLRATGNGVTPDASTYPIISTGERMQFSGQPGNVCKDLVMAELRTPEDVKDVNRNLTHSKTDYVVPVNNDAVDDHAHNTLHDEDDSHSSPGHGVIRPLLAEIVAKLRKLPLVCNDCDVCSNSSLIWKDSNMTKKHLVKDIPCQHTLSLINAPQVYDMRIFEDSIDAKIPLEDAYLRSIKSTGKSHVLSSEYHTSRSMFAAQSMTRSATSYENEDTDGHANVDVDVDHLLTYRPESVQGGAYDFSENYTQDDNPFDGEYREFNFLENIDNKCLRRVAAMLPANEGKNVHAWSLVEELNVSKADDKNIQFSGDTTIALTGETYDCHAMNRSQWNCPEEFRLAGLQDSASQKVSARRASNYEDSSTIYSFSTLRSRSLDMFTMGQLEKSNTMVSGDAFNGYDDDLYYDDDMSMDVLLEKYIRLRKNENCPATILRALKHLICFRLGKERLYLKPKEGEGSDEAGGKKGSNILQDLLATIASYEAPLQALEDTARLDKGYDDTDSVYTYSSISISSYETVSESAFVPLDPRDLSNFIDMKVHNDTVEIYGILTVQDENKSMVIPRNKAKMYCELVGDMMNFYLLKKDAKSLVDGIEGDPLISLTLDPSVICTPLKDRKTGESVMRLTGTKYTINNGNEYQEVPGDAKDEDDDSYLLYLKLFSTPDDIRRWHTAIIAKQKIRQFTSMLERDHQIVPYGWNLYSLLYPHLMEVDLSCMPFNNHIDSVIANTFVMHPIRSLLASQRQITDEDIPNFLSTWNFYIETLDLSKNNITLKEGGEKFAEYIRNCNVRNLILDGNPLSPEAYTLLKELLHEGIVERLSLRNCTFDESIMAIVKGLNQKMKPTSKLFIDVRDCNGSEETLRFFKSYPLTRLKLITSTSQGLETELGIDAFMDCKSLVEIYEMGTVFTGKLLSAHESNPQKFRFLRMCRKKQKNYTVEGDYMFFEYKPPYLVAYDPKEVRKSNINKPKRGKFLYITSCNIAMMNNLRWLQLKGTVPASLATTKQETKCFLVRAYSDKATRRWFEVINRTLAGVEYVKYLKKHKDVQPSRFIISFCRFPDISQLVLYDLEYDRDLWVEFFRCINSQSSLTVVDFSNKKLTAEQLTFPEFLFGGIMLECLSFAFNNVSLMGATEEVFNGIIPPLTCQTYNISHNPLGDCELSAKLFVRACTSAYAVKACFNNCKLGDTFLSKAIELFNDGDYEEGGYPLETVELESNSFSAVLLDEFVSVITAKFPSLISIRLYNSVESANLTPELLQEATVSLEDSFVVKEPAFGHFRHLKHMKKKKRTTRESVAMRLEEARRS
ncbi:hypothetical protein BgAZ_208860 [Babesia gibsoni]|uniref:Uncharacterized protein n=1 Tax=Babesia gibsoni TaxID=33632 RepID=A0AAD8UQX1_BABGI|nr:hypothetical protein BgAZ_208860 [Babesia gibsoni]